MNQIEKIIDIATWNRREHYEHFSAFDDPFFGVTVQVDWFFVKFGGTSSIVNK